MPPHISDYIAVSEILRLCAHGFSNSDIARLTNFDEEYIKETLENFVDFSGWNETQDISGYSVYRKSNSYYDFLSKVQSFSPLVEDKQAYESYRICKIYEEIIQEIEKYYEQ